jgi:predicted nucleotidyltransferase
VFQCSSDQVLGFLAAELRRSGVGVQKLVVFGSRARGEDTEDSDLDVAVVSSDYEGRDIFERVRLAKKAVMTTADRFVIPLDIAHLTPEEYESRNSPIASFAHEGEEFQP